MIKLVIFTKKKRNLPRTWTGGIWENTHQHTHHPARIVIYLNIWNQVKNRTIRIERETHTSYRTRDWSASVF